MASCRIGASNSWTPWMPLLVFGDNKRGEGMPIFHGRKKGGTAHMGHGKFSCEKRCGGMEDFISHGLSSWLSPILNRIQNLDQILTNS